MIVIEDKGQQTNKHELKHIYFESHGIYWERYPLPCGDYILCTNEVMDVIARKQKRGMEPKKMDFLGTYSICVDTKKDFTGNYLAMFVDGSMKDFVMNVFWLRITTFD